MREVARRGSAGARSKPPNEETATDMTETSSTYRQIYAVVAHIPKGRVATYGQIAILAGLPRHARLVGYALNALPGGTRVPWHRVVNAKGQVSLRGDGQGHEELQTQLLQREGVRFVGGTLSLARYRWQPRARVQRAPRKPRKATT